ncbi:MAG: DUF1460 domain-containing protein [Bacteroidetes bacterium]|nr:MAG: DUF1460 domain-containing protein [Bacteroidota bacterium]
MTIYMTFLKNCLFALLFCCLAHGLCAQTHCTAASRQLCEAELQRLQDPALQARPIHELALEVGTHFLGTPYQAHTLETEGEEQLVIELEGLDCTTFIENVVVFSRLAKLGHTSFEAFERELERIRYRNGSRNGYSSRLHYFTEWIQNNEEKGIIRDVSKEIGGIPYQKPLNVMSTHRDSYRQLAEQAHYAAIVQIEQQLNQTQRPRYYLPKERLQSLESGLQDGDLVAITTTIKGLDVVHTGMVKWQDGRPHLFHASSKNKKVEISDEPLADYLMASKIRSGIIVCRLVEPLKTGE